MPSKKPLVLIARAQTLIDQLNRIMEDLTDAAEWSSEAKTLSNPSRPKKKARERYDDPDSR